MHEVPVGAAGRQGPVLRGVQVRGMPLCSQQCVPQVALWHPPGILRPRCWRLWRRQTVASVQGAAAAVERGCASAGRFFITLYITIYALSILIILFGTS